MKSAIVVSGGAEFIGSNFVIDWMETETDEIVNLNKLTYAGNEQSLALLQSNAHHLFIHGNTGDRALVDGLLMQHRPRAVVNSAAESHVDRSIHDPGGFIQTNIVGAFNLLKSVRSYYGQLQPAEKRRFRFLHVSTDEVYRSLASHDLPFR